jgi:hypothetical protein
LKYRIDQNATLRGSSDKQACQQAQTEHDTLTARH